MKNLILLTFILFFSATGWSQYTSEESGKRENPMKELSFYDRLYTGGNMGFNVANSWVFLELSPYVGYRVTEDFSVGVGAKYLYYGSKQWGIRYTIYGGGVFSRYAFTENLFAHAEFERLSVPTFNSTINERVNANMLFAGAGYSNMLGARSSVQILLLYDFIQDPYSPYIGSYIFGPQGPPIIYRLGFSFGI